MWAGAQRKARSGGGEEEVESEDEEEEEESLLRTEPPQWERDDAATHCTRCQSEFSLLWRRVPSSPATHSHVWSHINANPPSTAPLQVLWWDLLRHVLAVQLAPAVLARPHPAAGVR